MVAAAGRRRHPGEATRLVNASRLWGICCLFNPARYRVRARNFRVFRAHLAIPLVAVELTFDGAFELDSCDAEVLVQVRDGGVMWQKERLINLGLSRLPPDCEAVAILDADILFTDSGWAGHAVAALDRMPAVQLFRDVRQVCAGQTAQKSRVLEPDGQTGVACLLDAGVEPESLLGPQPGTGRGVASPGFAWAFRRDLIERHGLFDANIAGGGDTALACASTGAFDAAERRHRMTAEHRAHFRRWAIPWSRAVNGRIGYLDQSLLHLWHGDLVDRKAAERHRILADHAFDPSRDISLGNGGAWQWSSEKHGLHGAMQRYFLERHEDG